ncbi:hypothetical protein GE09DRAFT_1106719 [Coniochaeta sp. 2T2.1]|nr:hypothetical protein GE09DRAFT_1106719 [Coniochaeta sp. 2T2.1]
MSSQLFQYFYDGDVDKFRALLAPAAHNAHHASRAYNSGGGGGSAGSPGHLATSPQAIMRTRKALGARPGANILGKNEVNFRDPDGLTLLLLAASSSADGAIGFVEALLEHPPTDLYVTDYENGWNCLHRALYFGNISIARLLLDKERRSLNGETIGASFNKVGQLIKTKDHEGNSPFDLYSSTIGERPEEEEEQEYLEDEKEETPSYGKRFIDEYQIRDLCDPPDPDPGEELFTFGSNKNLSLGLGDQDDRQFPERVVLKRPDHLLTRWHQEHLDKTGQDGTASSDISKIPALIQSTPLFICDVVLSKLHSAVLTKDEVSNLYVCGVGRGGRLGLGDENTRFTYACVQGGLAGKKVAQVALGQNHSMALTENGELWTWGSNAASQLGYVLPPPPRPDEEPMTTSPIRVFGPLKKELVLGIAASAIHSVAHTGSALYCWGKNVGQLGLMDADSRSLEVQQTPRRVAASLLQSNIAQVAAIDKATICLLRNNTVVCFTSYGYTIVKFPTVMDMLTGSELSFYMPRSAVARNSNRGKTEIVRITASGETVAAVSSQGELFTFGLSQKVDDSSLAMSTTNPSKIRTSITTPQCIWNGKRDGVNSVGIGEHGSVIISTRSGAVWRRVKRAKAKDAYVASASGPKRNEYKFQRVPGITNIIRVAASPFGAFAAIRRDLKIMRKKIQVGKQTLWDDVAALNPMVDFRASEQTAGNGASSFWGGAANKDRLAPLAYQALKSPDLESDLQHYLHNWSYGNEPVDAAICTSSAPELVVPVHGWLLSARSPVLRQALVSLRKDGSTFSSETFRIENARGKILVTFVGLDIISILNLVLFMYADEAIPAWNFSRAAPPMAYRFRQVRVELMKVSGHLKMMTLEKAVRMQSDQPEKRLDQDLDDALHAPGFLNDGDVLLELDGDAIPAHSSLLRQRCPWFETMFQGRSGGKWLARRRETLGDGDRIRIDLKHIDPDVFKHVLRYLYADCGDKMFDEVVSPTVDDFTDLVMDVMSVANELMLDRLAQICQKVMGKFVNTRNIAYLLNAISPCAVTEFKDAGLEYICLQMETMLENHLLDELDPELMAELDAVVQDNQLARQPFARSGRAELLLNEQYPWLPSEIEEERRIRVKQIAFRAAQKEEEKRMAPASRARYGSLDDSVLQPPDRARKVSRAARNEPFSPDLRPKQSQNDLMFDMEDEDTSVMDSPSARASRRAETRQMSLSQGAAASPGAQLSASLRLPRSQQTVPVMGTPKQERSASSGTPWKPSPLPTAKLDLRDVFKPASPAVPSGISAGIAAQKMRESSAPKPAPPKLSQKERKKQQQAQAAEAAVLAASSQTPKPVWDKDQASPWKIASAKGKPPATTTPSGSLPQASAVPKPLVAAESSRQHVSRRTASPDTRFSGQSRTPSSTNIAALRPPVRGNTPVQASPSSLPKPPPHSSSTTQQPPPLIPHSKSYITRPPKDEPLLGLSIADIMAHEQREREVVKEAVAKRSLQEIQEEQQFQQWWDAESRRTQEEEARRLNPNLVKGKDKDDGGKRGGRRGRGKGGRAGASSSTTPTQATPSGPKQEGGSNQPGRGKGRWDRGGGPTTAV